MAIHQVIHMVPVGNLWMTAARAMDMIPGMPAAGMLRRTRGGVGCVDRQNVLVHVIAMDMVQVAVVQVIGVAVVLDGHVPTSRTVLVAVCRVDLAGFLWHDVFLLVGA